MTSQYSKETKTRINYSGGPLKHTLRRTSCFARSDYNCRGRSISRDRTPAEIRHFFMTKAHHSGSKASIDYPWQPLKHTLS